MAADTGGFEPEAVVFFHAHPDDEAIFTGGTMARLAQLGHRVVVVFATGGEAGLPAAPTQDDRPLGQIRRDESHAAAAILGVERVVFLGYADSGLEPDPTAITQAVPAGLEDHSSDPAAFTNAAVSDAARRLAQVLSQEAVPTLVIYDEHGIYGHPDHLQVWRVGQAAAALAGTTTVYEATVDREYLHFVETHLVVEADSGRPGGPTRPGLGLAATSIGTPTVLIDCSIDVSSVLDRKRRAMAAHASQIPESSSALRLAPADFAEVYGIEWYLRSGPAGPLDALTPAGGPPR